MDDVIDSKINILKGDGNRNIEINFRRLIQRLEDIKKMINERRDRIDGGKRKRKRTQKKRKKSKKDKKSKKIKSVSQNERANIVNKFFSMIII